jgi:phosphopantothenoylcysteine synthetase/decarboxylase
MIAVNDVSIKGAGFESEKNEMIIITKNGFIEKIPLAFKSEVAGKIISIVAKDNQKKINCI